MEALLPTKKTSEKVVRYLEGERDIKADCVHRKLIKGSAALFGVGVAGFAISGALTLLTRIPMIWAPETVITPVGGVLGIVCALVEYSDAYSMYDEDNRCYDEDILDKRARKTCIELEWDGQELLALRRSIVKDLNVVSERQAAMAQKSIDAAILAYQKRCNEMQGLQAKKANVKGEVVEGSIQAAFIQALDTKTAGLREQNTEVLTTLREMYVRAEEARCAVELAKVVGLDQLSLPQTHEGTLVALNEWLGTYTDAWKDPSVLQISESGVS